MKPYSSLTLYYQLIIRDKTGRLVRKTRLRRSHSFVIAFLQLIHTQMNQISTSIIHDDGSETGVTQSSVNLQADPADDSIRYGTVVGTGDTPVDNIDYQLEAKLDSGSGAGELEYGSQSFVAPAVVGLNVDLITTRTFHNSSGGAIIIKEIGLQCKNQVGRYDLLIHDVLDDSETVEDTQTLTVVYTLRTAA